MLYGRKEKHSMVVSQMSLLNSAECSCTMSSIFKTKLVCTEFTFAVVCAAKVNSVKMVVSLLLDTLT